MNPHQLFSARRTPLCAACFSFAALLLEGCWPSPEPIRSDPSRYSAIPSVRQTPLIAPLPAESPKASSLEFVPKFVDVAQAMGIDFTFHNDAVKGRYLLPEVMGGGVAWIDLDGDGWLDLFLANGRDLERDVDVSGSESQQQACRLYRNNEGERFAEITQPSGSGIGLYGQGCAVGDYDSDGFSDLFISGYGPDHLLRNRGDGTFEDVTDEAGVSDPVWSSSALWIDLDGDSDLDLYVTNYLNVSSQNNKVCDYGGRPGYCGPGSYEAVQDCAYLNLGDGSFEESAERLGLHAENGKGLAVAAADFDGDLVPEIYVANDMTANFLFVRTPLQEGGDSGGTLYRECAAQAGCAVSGTGMNEASMGIALADFDGDSRIDIYLTHYYHMKNTVYQNLGNLLFDDVSYWSRAAAISHESLGFGTVPLDYDRDGDPDLFVTNGHVLGPEQIPNAMPPQLLHNEGGVFTEVSSSAGEYFQKALIGRSVAAGDFDNDGDVDLAISHLDTPFVLLKNESPVSNRPFVGLQLSTIHRSRPTGARVVVKTTNLQFSTSVTSGGSYLASADERVLTGWPGDHDELVSLEIHWPSGRVDRLGDISPNHYWRVREGASPRHW